MQTYSEKIVVFSSGQTVFAASKAKAIYPGTYSTTYVFTCPKQANRWFKWLIRKIETIVPCHYRFEFSNDRSGAI